MPNTKLSKYFVLKELTYLPKLDCFHTPSPEEVANLTKLAQKMDLVREFFGKMVIVHCAIRPGSVNCPEHPDKSGIDYNKLVGGATNSYHKTGLAIDFHVAGVDCDEVRKRLEPKLEEWNLRMEDLPGSNWVHLDLGAVGKSGKRFFKP